MIPQSPLKAFTLADNLAGGCDVWDTLGSKKDILLGRHALSFLAFPDGRREEGLLNGGKGRASKLNASPRLRKRLRLAILRLQIAILRLRLAIPTRQQRCLMTPLRDFET